MTVRLRGRLPFDGDRQETIIKAIVTAQPDYNNSAFLNLSYNVCLKRDNEIQCREAIKGLLQKNPDMRLSADDLMHHPWFADMKTRMKIRPYKPKLTPSSRLRQIKVDEEEKPEEVPMEQKTEEQQDCILFERLNKHSKSGDVYHYDVLSVLVLRILHIEDNLDKQDNLSGKTSDSACNTPDTPFHHLNNNNTNDMSFLEVYNLGNHLNCIQYDDTR